MPCLLVLQYVVVQPCATWPSNIERGWYVVELGLGFTAVLVGIEGVAGDQVCAVFAFCANSTMEGGGGNTALL